MTVDTVKCDVIIKGLFDEVMNAKQDIFDALRKFNHTRHCQAEAAIIKEQVQWYLKVSITNKTNFKRYKIFTN